MRTTASLLALAISSLALGGCQALFGSPSFAERAPVDKTAPIDMSDYFAGRLQTGRLHLAQGRPTQAITAFRQASYDPAYAGRAYNGMGVAYAQMGRQDLARRYFSMALAADPQDERFARNLARLENVPSFELDTPALADADEAHASASVSGESAAGGTAAEEAGLRRVSSREVRVLTGGLRAETAAAEEPPATRPDSPVVLARSDRTGSYPVRIELPRASAPQRANYPVRIALSNVKVTQRSIYPIRIELPDPQ